MLGHPPEPPRTLEKLSVELPGVTGTLYVGTGYRQDPESRVLQVLCSPFNLEPPVTFPADDLYRKLAQASVLRADQFGACIHAAVDEAVKTHAIVQRVGSSHPQRPPLVRPCYERAVGPYVLYYGTLFPTYVRIMEEWAQCTTCLEDYPYHVDNLCPGFLGERFTSYIPEELDGLVRMLVFANNLQAWVNKHAESILNLALERLNGQQKTGPFTGDSAGRKFTPYVASISTRIAGATSDGPGHPVSGEPGDNGNR